MRWDHNLQNLIDQEWMLALLLSGRVKGRFGAWLLHDFACFRKGMILAHR